MSGSNGHGLTKAEKGDLIRLEAAVDRGTAGFREAALALHEIRTKRLYRAEYKTFEQYVEARWDFGVRYAHALVQAADVLLDLGVGEAVLPANEVQARVLGEMDTQEERREVWREAVEEAEGEQPATARLAELVQAAKDAMAPESAARLAALEEDRLIKEQAEQEEEGAEEMRERWEKRFFERAGQARKLAVRLGWKRVARVVQDAIETAEGEETSG